MAFLVTKTEPFDKGISTKIKLWFVSLSLIITTPLCGFLFQCGCDWPWRGLHFACNHYQPEAIYKCPWCASILAGAASVGFAMLVGLRFSLLGCPVSFKSHICEIGARTMCGLVFFILVAIFTAVLAAFWQDYPLGVGQVFNSF